jgi:hypothetical protein
MPEASELVFSVEPVDTIAGLAILPPVEVAIKDEVGDIISTATNPVTIEIEDNPSAGILSGILIRRAVNGVATFPGLRIDEPGEGYTLRATCELTPPLPPITWASITGATQDPIGLLTKTALGGWGNCGAISSEELSGDARLTFYWEHTGSVPQWFIGFGPDSSCTSFSTINYAYNLRSLNNDAQVWENGGQPAANPDGTTPNFDGITYAMLEIERVAGIVRYYYKLYDPMDPRPSPGDPGRTLIQTSVTSLAGTVRVNVAGFGNGSVIDAANIIWAAI